MTMARNPVDRSPGDDSPGDDSPGDDSPGDDSFLRQADPYRRELLAHCYRMLGSVHDAEDLVQETYLRAWRGYGKFEGRSSLRTWLYRIATTACLTALEGRNRRPLPAGLGAPAADPADELARGAEVPWLEPVPDVMVGDRDDDPATIVESRESIRLAFVAALQHLPARQRAVLILRDVLKWRAAEVARQLDTTVTAVNSMLQRARAQLEQAAPTRDRLTRPITAEQRDLLERYVVAFQAKDIAAMVELFTEDIVWEMPPFTSWFQGPADIAHHLDVRCPARPGLVRLVRTDANGQPAYGTYLFDDTGSGYAAFNLQVLSLGPAGITHVVSFFDLSLFDTFGLPRTLPETHPAAPARSGAVAPA